jgi:AhpD family alkylhydroperoxidase
MQARMSQNPVMIEPFALQALQTLRKSAEHGAVPSGTIGLVQLRASQINGCSACVDQHCRFLKEAGETDERLFAVAAWRDAPYFTDAERAALALAEAVTRLADQGLAVLILMIATANLFNRLNATRPSGGRQPELVAPDPRCGGSGGEHNSRKW